MAEYRRRISGLNSEQVMHAMGIDDAYHVERVLVRNSNGVTELVTIEGAGPFVRKKMPLDEVNRSVWAAIAGNDCARLPQVAATYEMPDCFAAVYDYVPGETLEDVMARSDALDVGSAVQLATDVCEALAALHRRGVIHLDIAPRNIIVAADGAHVIDFGNARLIADSGDVHGETVRPKGTWGFAAPEQFFSRASVRSDVFAVGRLLGYMLTGIQPDDDRISAFETALRDESRVPAPVRLLIERATAFEPSARPASARELAAELGAAARGDVEARPQMPSTARASAACAASDDSASVSDGAAARTGGHERSSAGARRITAVGVATIVLACAAAVMGIAVAYKVLEEPLRTALSAGDAGPALVQGVHGASDANDAASSAPGGASQADVHRAADSLGIVESGWRTNASGYVDYAVTLKNASEDLTVEFPAINIVGRDASGAVLFSSEQVMGVLFPGSTMTFACMAGDGTAPSSVEFSLVKPQDYQVRRATGKPTAYEVHGVSARRGAHGELAISGELELSTEGDEPLPVGDVWLSVLFRDAEGKIISGMNGFVPSPDAGERAPFSIQLFDCPDYATLDVVPLAH